MKIQQSTEARWSDLKSNLRLSRPIFLPKGGGAIRGMSHGYYWSSNRPCISRLGAPG